MFCNGGLDGWPRVVTAKDRVRWWNREWKAQEEQKNAKKNSYHQPVPPRVSWPLFSVYFTIYDFLLSRRGSNIDTLTASGARLLRFV